MKQGQPKQAWIKNYLNNDDGNNSKTNSKKLDGFQIVISPLIKPELYVLRMMHENENIWKIAIKMCIT